MRRAVLALVGLLPALAFGQDPVDLGVLRQDDVVVVQRMLYPKTDRTEIGAGLAYAAWDRYTTTPALNLGVDLHQSEAVGLSLQLGVGYGLKNGTYRELERVHGVAPYSFRYLGSAMFGVSYSPIYGKISVAKRRVVHHDLYGVARGGVTLERSVIPQGGMPIAPTVSVGVGMRVFTPGNLAIRVEARDDVFFESRKLTGDLAMRQRFWVGLGISQLSAVSR